MNIYILNIKIINCNNCRRKSLSLRPLSKSRGKSSSENSSIVPFLVILSLRFTSTFVVKCVKILLQVFGIPFVSIHARSKLVGDPSTIEPIRWLLHILKLLQIVNLTLVILRLTNSLSVVETVPHVTSKTLIQRFPRAETIGDEKYALSSLSSLLVTVIMTESFLSISVLPIDVLVLSLLLGVLKDSNTSASDSMTSSALATLDVVGNASLICNDFEYGIGAVGVRNFDC
ncbi:hypothetical protein AGLY_009210 [Aphis glycines]|uniref:Uncharacterized protein n=1 Tax=Aphis glycines TaxID=307491 RepID=A0A6G0TIT8_APHGL|nr:hypothetical protein AGLY_009210 [Aphis glycines]